MRSPVLVNSLSDTGAPAEEAFLSVVPLAEWHGVRFWAIPAGMLVLVLALFVALLVVPDSSSRAGISALSQSLAMLLAVGASLLVFRRTQAGRARWSWGLITLAFLSYLVADLVAIVLSFTLPPTEATYLAGAVFLPFFPLLAAGIVLLPSAPRSGVQQARVVLDVCIGAGALFGLDLVFLMAPRFVRADLLDIVYTAYPVADLVLLLAVILLLVRGVQQAYHQSFFWLMVGTTCFVFADSVFNTLSLPAPGQTGSNVSIGQPAVDPFWLAGIFAFGLAALSLLVRGKAQSAGWAWIDRLAAFEQWSQRSRTQGQFALLIAPVAVLSSLLVYIEAQQAGNQKALFPLTGVLFALVLLIIIRLWLTMRDLVDARIATERAQQLDALKDQFITSVNHELRTPLMTMQGNIHLLGDPDAHPTPEKRTEMLERARKACDQLVHLVRSILDTRRIDEEAGDFVSEAVNLRTALEVALSLIDSHEADPSGRRLSVRIPEEVLVWGETVRVQQILTNLLSNAIKYSPPEAPIVVSAQLVQAKTTGFLSVKSSGRTARPMVEIIVQDGGLGIPPEQQDLLFRRFVRLPRDIAGTIHGNGLGLYLCRVYAEVMGGSIWVQSTGVPGEGAAFHLRLPAPIQASVQWVPSVFGAPPRSDEQG